MAEVGGEGWILDQRRLEIVVVWVWIGGLWVRWWVWNCGSSDEFGSVDRCIVGQVVSWWHVFRSMGCVGRGSGDGFGVVGQVGLWCVDLWVSLGYLMVVLLGLGTVRGFVGGSNGDFFKMGYVGFWFSLN